MTLECGRGCGACRDTGYRGRTGIFELVTVTERFKQALLQGADGASLREIARHDGTTTLRTDGWRKVQAGITTVEEVLRVVQD